MIVLLSRARLGMFILANVGYFEEKADASIRFHSFLSTIQAVLDIRHDWFFLSKKAHIGNDVYREPLKSDIAKYNRYR